MGYLLIQASSWTTWREKRGQKCSSKSILVLKGISMLLYSQKSCTSISRRQREKKSYELKKKPELVKSVEVDDIIELLRRYKMLDIGETVKNKAEGLITKYGLLPNDALIAATCKHHGIPKIATFDPDFDRVDFLEVITPE